MPQIGYKQTVDGTRRGGGDGRHYFQRGRARAETWVTRVKNPSANHEFGAIVSQRGKLWQFSEFMTLTLKLIKH